VTVAEHRANADFARAMQRLVDVDFPDATCIRVVLDNLITHSAAALYQTFAPAEAPRITQRLAFHSTPKHASWLNMAELELAAFTLQCLRRRLPANRPSTIATSSPQRGTDWRARIARA
jgi:hypothetical protein